MFYQTTVVLINSEYKMQILTNMLVMFFLLLLLVMPGDEAEQRL